MSDDIRNKVKNSFIDSIKVKQEILDLDLHQVLLEAGEKISESIGQFSASWLADSFSISAFSSSAAALLVFISKASSLDLSSELVRLVALTW